MARPSFVTFKNTPFWQTVALRPDLLKQCMVLPELLEITHLAKSNKIKTVWTPITGENLFSRKLGLKDYLECVPKLESLHDSGLVYRNFFIGGIFMHKNSRATFWNLQHLDFLDPARGEQQKSYDHFNLAAACISCADIDQQLKILDKYKQVNDTNDPLLRLFVNTSPMHQYTVISNKI